MSRIFFKLFVLLLVYVVGSCKSGSTMKEHDSESIVDSKRFMLADVPYCHDHIAGGTLEGNQLVSMKEYLFSAHHIDLDEINYLTVSYLKSSNDCWYDSYKMMNTSAQIEFIENEKVKSNTTLLHLHYDKGHGGGISKYDIEHFFHDLFPETHGSSYCDYTITLSKSGAYLLKVSHFDIKVANAFRNELEAHELKNSNKN